MYYSCGKKPGTRNDRAMGLLNRQQSVEVCHVRSTLKPDPDSVCAGCTKWMEAMPPNCVEVCPNCGAVLVVITIKKCPMCKGELDNEY